MTNLVIYRAIRGMLERNRTLSQLMTVNVAYKALKVGIFHRGINVMISSADHGYDLEIVFCNLAVDNVKLTVSTSEELLKALEWLALDSYEFTISDVCNGTQFYNVQLRNEWSEHRLFVNGACVFTSVDGYEFLEVTNVVVPFMLKIS